MSAAHPVQKETLDVLKERAIEHMDAALKSVAGWVERIREPEHPARMRWAVETTRPGNVAATANVLGGLEYVGLFDRLITDADRRCGVDWVRGMRDAAGQYRDPALVDRRSPDWPADEPWPSPAMLENVTGYARHVLIQYGGDAIDLPLQRPADGWPQPEDPPERTVQWIRDRPWDSEPWGAGSHGQRIATYLLEWYKQGRMSLDPLIDALQFFYDTQDPETGLWGGRSVERQYRVNCTFKLFPLIRDRLDLPLPHPDRIVDRVLEEFYRPDLDDSAGGCDEGNKWYLVCHALEESGNHRRDELQRMAAYRIVRLIELFSKSDGGFSCSPSVCQPGWVGFDMAPPIPQSDAMGLSTIGRSVSMCVALLGIENATAWTGDWRAGAVSEPTELRDEIASRIPQLARIS